MPNIYHLAGKSDISNTRSVIVMEDGTDGRGVQEGQFPEEPGPKRAVYQFYEEAVRRGQTVRVFQRYGEAGGRTRARLGRFTAVNDNRISEMQSTLWQAESLTLAQPCSVFLYYNVGMERNRESLTFFPPVNIIATGPKD